MLPQNKDQLHERKTSGTMDMCHGPLMLQIIIFTLPLFFSWLLQFAFNAADTIVIGKFGSAQSMASVGSTAVVITFLLNLLFGLSSGTAVLTSQYFGAKDYRRVSKIAHTSILVAIIGGVILGITGIVLSKPLLRLMAVPENLLPKSIQYLCICCLGLPFQTLYSFGSAIMRSLGDTKRPMFFIIFAGIINVILNLIFVILFKMDVAGVAIATVISNGISAFLVCLALARNEEPFRLHLHKMKIDMTEFKKQLKIGVPSSFQSSFFTLSNMIIQSSVNTLGDTAMAGNTAAQSLESIVYLASLCAFHAALTFVGQNYGGKQYKRIKKSILYTGITSFAICELVGFTFLLFNRQLLSLYTTDSEVMKIAFQRMLLLYSTYGICGLMDTVSGSLRGLGNAIFPSVTIFITVCAMRVLWAYTIFGHFHTMFSLMWSYPISWALAAAINLIYLCYILKKHIKPQLKQQLS